MTTVAEGDFQSHQPAKKIFSRSALSALFSRLQNLFAVTVWPEEQDNTLNLPDDEDNGLHPPFFLLFKVIVSHFEMDDQKICFCLETNVPLNQSRVFRPQHLMQH